MDIIAEKSTLDSNIEPPEPEGVNSHVENIVSPGRAIEHEVPLDLPHPPVHP